jgi:hypothetical protein
MVGVYTEWQATYGVGEVYSERVEKFEVVV